MWAFVSHHLGGDEELHSRLEQVEIDLTAARKMAEDGTEALKLAEMERESFRTETDKQRKRAKLRRPNLKGSSRRIPS